MVVCGGTSPSCVFLCGFGANDSLMHCILSVRQLQAKVETLEGEKRDLEVRLCTERHELFMRFEEENEQLRNQLVSALHSPAPPLCSAFMACAADGDGGMLVCSWAECTSGDETTLQVQSRAGSRTGSHQQRVCCLFIFPSGGVGLRRIP